MNWKNKAVVGLMAVVVGCGPSVADDDDAASNSAGSGGVASTGEDEDASQTEDGGEAGGGAATTSGAEGASSGSTTGVVVNDCGTFEPLDNHNNVPPDPDDPALLQACEAGCARVVEDTDCGFTDAVACVEACRLRTCSACPGTMAALVACEAELWDRLSCTCDTLILQCEHADGPCADLEDATWQCGG